MTIEGPGTLVVPIVAPVAPVAVTPPAPAAPAVTPPAPAAVAPPETADPAWLTQRLARERAKGESAALTAAGFTSPADAKAAAVAAKAALDATKSAETRAAELQQTVASEKARADSLTAVATEHAARMMFGLTPEQQAAVRAVAGEDPARQLQTIGALSPTWVKPAAPVVAAPVVAAPVTPAAPAPAVSTAPAGGAPNGTLPAPSDLRGSYESARSSNPFAAARFGLANATVYTPK